MEAAATGPAMVNPSADDEKKFRRLIKIVDQINSLRSQGFSTIADMQDIDLKRNAGMLLGEPDEYARKL